MWSLAIAGLLLAVCFHLSGPDVSPLVLLYTVVAPVGAFSTLAMAVRRRRSDGTWLYRLRHIGSLALMVGVLIVAPYVWWWSEYGGDHYDGGGVNFALGCSVTAVPILLPFVLIVGLALAKESASR
jgi:hypothetical protein